MATISPVTMTGGALHTRTASAQATTGQTDWIQVPNWARFCVVDFNLTAVSGNTPISLLSIVQPDLTTQDDTTGVVNLMGYTAFTALTAAGRQILEIGPGITGIADDVATAASGLTNAALNCILPGTMGVKILNDRTTGDETYTYTLSVRFSV